MKEPLLTLTSYELVFPEHANPNGAAFGGFVLGLMDKVASYAAAKYARNTVVTVSVSEVEFKVPVRVGDLLEIRASVLSQGRTSMIINVDVFRDKFGSAQQHPISATQGEFRFVSVNQFGEPVPLQSQ